MQWYYAENGKQQGPVEFEQLVALAHNGSLKPDDLVWNASMGNQWAKANTVSGLFEMQPPAVPVEPEPPAEWSNTATFKSAVANRDLTAQARTSLDQNWGKAIGGLLIYLLVLIVLAAIPFLGQVVSFVISGPMMVGWTLFYLNISRQEPADVGQLFDGFKLFGNAFVMYLLIMLLILAWCLPAFGVVIVMAVLGLKGVLMQDASAMGAIPFLIPLIIAAMIPVIVAQLRYFLAYYILNDYPGVGPMEAVRRSTQMMKGNKWKLFCLQLRFIGWGLLCVLTFGIGFLWLVPYMMVSMACFYDDVKDSGQ